MQVAMWAHQYLGASLSLKQLATDVEGGGLGVDAEVVLAIAF